MLSPLRSTVQRLYPIVAASFLLLVPAFAGQDSQINQIDAILSSLVTSASPGLAVLIKQDGRVIFNRGY